MYFTVFNNRLFLINKLFVKKINSYKQKIKIKHWKYATLYTSIFVMKYWIKQNVWSNINYYTNCLCLLYIHYIINLKLFCYKKYC